MANMAGMTSIEKDTVCLLVTRDPSLVDVVSATALTIGTPLSVVGEREDLRTLWPLAGVRLVGVDMVGRALEMGGGQGRTWVVGQPDASLFAASAELGAPALALPEASGRLAEVLGMGQEDDATASVVALVGGSGGVGASSLTVAAALLASKRGAKVAAIELATCGGGLDLLMGLEATSGVRWEHLREYSGELGQLDGQLVHGHGVSLLGMGREPGAGPTRSAVEAVLRSLGRSQDVVLVDAGAGEHLDWLARAQVIVVVAAHVRGVAAARMVVERLGVMGAQVVVRKMPGSVLPPVAVAEALGLPLLGTIRHCPAVAKLAGVGAGITAGPARRFTADVKVLLDGLLT